MYCDTKNNTNVFMQNIITDLLASLRFAKENVRNFPDLYDEFAILKEVISKEIDSEVLRLHDIQKVLDLLKQISTCFKSRKITGLLSMVAKHIYVSKLRTQIINSIIHLIHAHVSICSTKTYKNAIIALQYFISCLKEIVDGFLERSVNIVCLASNDYFYSPVLKKRNNIILSIPARDLLKLWKWVLMFHELGHYFFELKKDEFLSRFRESVSPIISDSAPTGYASISGLQKIWEEHWLCELISDLFGTYLGGVSFTNAFVVEVFQDNPARYTTHPPLDARMYSQLKYLGSVCNKVFAKDLNIIRSSWYEFRKKFPSTYLAYPFTSRILDEIIKIFNEVVGNPPFLNFAHDILRLREIINENKDFCSAFFRYYRGLFKQGLIQ